MEQCDARSVEHVPDIFCCTTEPVFSHAHPPPLHAPALLHGSSSAGQLGAAIPLLSPSATGFYQMQQDSGYQQLSSFVSPTPTPALLNPKANIDPNKIVPLDSPAFKLHTIFGSGSPNKSLQKPRPPMSSYVYFLQERRDMYRKIEKPVKFTSFSKECAAIWGKMSSEQKEEFKHLSSLDKERYSKELEEYKLNTEKKTSKRGRKKRQPGQPKRNMCAFLFYSAEKRPKLKSKNPKLTNGDNSKLLSEEWKRMTTEEKEPYVKMASDDKMRYSRQKEFYNNGYQSGILSTNSELCKLKTKKDPGMPKRNMSAFLFFSCSKRPELKATNPSATFIAQSKMLAEAWRQLTPSQKASYELMAHNDKERYHQQKAIYRHAKSVAQETNAT